MILKTVLAAPVTLNACRTLKEAIQMKGMKAKRRSQFLSLAFDTLKPGPRRSYWGSIGVILVAICTASCASIKHMRPIVQPAELARDWVGFDQAGGSFYRLHLTGTTGRLIEVIDSVSPPMVHRIAHWELKDGMLFLTSERGSSVASVHAVLFSQGLIRLEVRGEGWMQRILMRPASSVEQMLTHSASAVGSDSN